MTELRVIVCGGRKYAKAWRVFEALELVRRVFDGKLIIIEGNADGVDDAAGKWARRAERDGRNVEHLSFPADWKRFGRSAGPRRNAQMLEEGQPDLCIAFPGGKGTQNMISQARAADVLVIRGETLRDVQDAVGEVV